MDGYINRINSIICNMYLFITALMHVINKSNLFHGRYIEWIGNLNTNHAITRSSI